jgi:hypothetical protein
MKTKVKLAREGSGTWKVKIDGVAIAFSNGKAEQELDDGRHKLKWWVVAGQPGAAFKVAIESPEAIKWSTSEAARLDGAGRTDGSKGFRLGPERNGSGS